MKKTKSSSKKEKKYLIALYNTRSFLAMVASITVMFSSTYAIVGGLIKYALNNESIFNHFQYFTTDSNLLTLVAICMITPYAIEGYRKKRFSCPKWVAHFLYCGTTCVSLVMFFTIFFISWSNPELAFTGFNTFLHIICPILIIISFFMIESGYKYTIKDCFLCIIPIFIYELIYLVEVVFIGEANGGWADLYMVATYTPWWFSLPALTLIAFGLASLIAFVNNSLVDYRKKKLLSNLPDNNEYAPAALKIEFFGLGRYIGKFNRNSALELPMDLIDLISEKYNLGKEELTKIYVKGFLDSRAGKGN